MRYAVLIKGPLASSPEEDEKKSEAPEWGLLALRDTKEEAELAASNVKRIWGIEAIAVPETDPRVKEYSEYVRRTRVAEEGGGDARLAIELGKKPSKEVYLIPQKKPPIETGIKRKIQEKLPLSIFPFIGGYPKKLAPPPPNRIKTARDRVRKVATRLLTKK
jgi:hypothetical protein